MINQEDNLSLEEVVKLCQTIKAENIEVNIDPITRPKNFEFVQKFNLAIIDIVDIIRHIRIEDFNKGPVEDDNPNFTHPFWVFNKYIQKIKIVVYIKLKIFNHKRKIVVFSIHEIGEYTI